MNTVRLTPRRTAKTAAALGILALAGSALGTPAHAASVGGTAQAGFTAPVQLPASNTFGEPSLAIDSAGRLFVTAPQTLGNITGGGSPVWTSANGGASFGAPVAPTGDPLSGGDTDLAIGPSDSVYQADLWLGNSAIAVSSDHGASFIANEYGHTQPGDDRPWLAYSKKDNALYLTYDGIDAVHVAKSAPLVTPQAGVVLAQDVPAVPESLVAVNGVSTPSTVRECVCPPGGIAVDQNSGQVYITYSRQNGGSNGGGVGVARSDDGGLTWTELSIPGTGSTGSAFDTEYNFAPVKVDTQGNVYVTWGEGINIDSNGVATGGVAIRFAVSPDHGAHWTTPVTVSTTTSTNTFPTMDVVSPGVVDVAYYGTSATGDPNTVAKSTTWNVDVATSSNALSATPTFTPAAAVTGIHTGCIQTGALASCSDRSLLDFFQLAVDPAGKANILYTAGDATSGTNLYFTKQI